MKISDEKYFQIMDEIGIGGDQPDKILQYALMHYPLEVNEFLVALFKKAVNVQNRLLEGKTLSIAQPILHKILDESDTLRCRN